MAKTLANCSIWFDNYAIASQVNQVSIDQSAAALDITTFANAGQARLPGLRDGVISVAGLWESLPTGGGPDSQFFLDVGQNVPVTVAMARNAPEGSVAYLMNSEIAEYKGIGAKVGNPLAFSIKAAQGGTTLGNTANSGRLAQGVLALNRTTTASLTSSYPVYQLPAVATMQSIVASLHVTAAQGTNIVFTLQSANNPSMLGNTVRWSGVTFAAPGSQIIEIPGPITDTYWGFSWTVSGGSPSFAIAAAIGNAY